MKRILLLLAVLFPISSPAQIFETTCPLGTVPLPWGTTVDPSNGQYRQYACSDSRGNVVMDGQSSAGFVNGSFYPGSDLGAEINNAIVNLPNGGTIFLPPGVSQFSTTIIVNNPGITFLGSGGWSSNATPQVATTILEYTGTGKAIDVQKSGFIGKQFSILLPNSSSAIGIYFENNSGGEGARLEGVQIYGAVITVGSQVGTGIQIGTPPSTGVYSISFYNVGIFYTGLGLYLAGNTNNFRFFGGSITDNLIGAQVGDSACSSAAGHNIQFIGTSFERNGNNSPASSAGQNSINVYAANVLSIKNFYSEFTPSEGASQRFIDLIGCSGVNPNAVYVQDGYIANTASISPIEVARVSGFVVRNVQFAAVGSTSLILNDATSVSGIRLMENNWSSSSTISSTTGVTEDYPDAVTNFHAYANASTLDWFNAAGARVQGFGLSSGNVWQLDPGQNYPFTLGGATGTNATAGELVFPNSKWLRGANAANNSVFAMLRVNGSNQVAIDESGTGLRAGTASTQITNGTGTLVASALDKSNIVTLSSAYTNATTTFSTITGMSWSVAASTNYFVTCRLIVSGSATTAGPKFQFTGPSSPTGFQMAAGPWLLSNTTTNVATALSTAVTAQGTLGASSVNYKVDVEAVLLNGSNSGTLTLQAAANGSGTLTLQPGSFCQIR
jgi:DNA/RNA endonuclease YhcR with UshA esterase domain